MDILESEVIFQIVNHSDGSRTSPVKTTFGRLLDVLVDQSESLSGASEHEYLADHVLICCDNIEGEMTVSGFPLMSVNSFIRYASSLVNRKEASNG